MRDKKAITGTAEQVVSCAENRWQHRMGEEGMSINEEIQGWLEQVRSEVRNLQVLLDNEQDEIETVQLVVEENVEVKAGSLQVTGIVKTEDSIDVGNLSHLVEKFSRHLKNGTDFHHQVKGAVGDRGVQGETGNRGPTGDAGDRGPQGKQGG
ncbi:MAG: collagen-like protein, partial [Candidatus Electrothrix sp. AX2]|nr:collagen-like protein [Candidatus Electrothrix gigas]